MLLGIAAQLHAQTGSVSCVMDAATLEGVKNVPGMAVIKFSTKTCPACRNVIEAYEVVAREFPDIAFVDVDASKVKEPGITAVPTVHYYLGGKRLHEMRGGGKDFAQRVRDDIAELRLAAQLMPEPTPMPGPMEPTDWETMAQEEVVAVPVWADVDYPPMAGPSEFAYAAEAEAYGQQAYAVPETYAGDPYEMPAEPWAAPWHEPVLPEEEYWPMQERAPMPAEIAPEFPPMRAVQPPPPPPAKEESLWDKAWGAVRYTADFVLDLWTGSIDAIRGLFGQK